MDTVLVEFNQPNGNFSMNTIKLIVATAILASVSFVTEQTPATEQNLRLEIAFECPQWPVCKHNGIYQGENFTDQNETKELPVTTKATIRKTA